MRKVKSFFLSLVILELFSCSTVDFEREAGNDVAVTGTASQYGEEGESVVPGAGAAAGTAAGTAPDPASNAAPEAESETAGEVTEDFDGSAFEPLVIERPVFIQAPEGSSSASVPARGQQAVRASNAEGIITPFDYSGAAMIYDYNPDWVYEIYTQPLRVTDISLEPGEKVAETPFISDSERWILGAGVSYENGEAVQHIYIKPSRVSLEASLIINTDRRVYHLVLKSFGSSYMPMIRWRFPLREFPNNYISGSQESGITSLSNSFDPRYISFNYRATYTVFRKPSWFPRLVFDDGRKTYIVLPEGVLQSTLPAVFDDRHDVINYRVFANVIIIDRLIEKITVSYEEREIVIEKKRG